MTVVEGLPAVGVLGVMVCHAPVPEYMVSVPPEAYTVLLNVMVKSLVTDTPVKLSAGTTDETVGAAVSMVTVSVDEAAERQPAPADCFAVMERLPSARTVPVPALMLYALDAQTYAFPVCEPSA